MTPAPSQPVWSQEVLFNKSLLFVEEMQRHTNDDWQFGLWSALSLELLARAALANISPALLANPRDWRNTYHALGYEPTTTKFVPSSIGTRSVLSILEEVLPDFPKELVEFCQVHTERRNAELHSGEDVFAELGTAAWLPRYYASCRLSSGQWRSPWAISSMMQRSRRTGLILGRHRSEGGSSGH